MSKYGTPKLSRDNFDKALQEWLYDYFGEEIYLRMRILISVLNKNLSYIDSNKTRTLSSQKLAYAFLEI